MIFGTDPSLYGAKIRKKIKSTKEIGSFLLKDSLHYRFHQKQTPQNEN